MLSTLIMAAAALSPTKQQRQDGTATISSHHPSALQPGDNKQLLPTQHTGSVVMSKAPPLSHQYQFPVVVPPPPVSTPISLLTLIGGKQQIPIGVTTLNRTDGQAANNGKYENEKQKCEDCGKLVKHLKSHMKVHNRPYACTECPSTYTDQSCLTTHERVHTGERPYPCDTCGKSFRVRSTLKRHMLVHTKGASTAVAHSCKACDRKFKSEHLLQKHQRTVHEGRKPYQCEECGREFSQWSSFKHHKMLHTGEKNFKCSYCDRAFRLKGHMQRHERLHNGNHPFTCEECGNGFGQRNELKAHMRTHTGEKPFSCLLCDKAFAQAGNLRRHVKRWHTGKEE